MSDGIATGLELRLQELIYAGLDALRASRPGIELAAYLHASGDSGPQLFLASPTLGSLKPNEAFDLFSALRDAMDRAAVGRGDGIGDGHADRAGELAGFHALTVVSQGKVSRGLHAVGRRGELLTAEDQEALGHLARSLASVNHTLEEVTRDLAT